MLPVGSGQGELWKGDSFLCAVTYDIGAPLAMFSDVNIQRVKLVVQSIDCEEQLDIPGITLVLADGSRHRLPRPVHLRSAGYLECFLDVYK